MQHMTVSLLSFGIMLITSPCWGATYATATTATPVLNSPEFHQVLGGRNGTSLKTDRCGQVRELEFIALPGTVFSIQGTIRQGTATIYRVETDEYPTAPGIRLYVDSRFVLLHDLKPPARTRTLPDKDAIIAALRSAAGQPYVWGGNQRRGIPGLDSLPSPNPEPGKRAPANVLAGLDCSGLLYEATNGWTPRNTSELVRFGTGRHIAGKSVAELVNLLKPLDLIVWDGHVIIVIDQGQVIESRLECGKPGYGGVVISALRQRLLEIMRTRRGADSWTAKGKQRNIFVVRQWINQ